MSVLIKHMAMPKGCIYANDKDQTEYCSMLNHYDVPFCQYIENEPETAIGIDERPVYCPLSDVPDTNVGDIISRQAAIDDIWTVSPLARLDRKWVDRWLRQLPPAQPEIIRCRNCKFASGDSRICMKFGHSPIGELDFCSFAERREVTT